MIHWTSLDRPALFCTGPCPPLVTSGGQDRKPVQTCSLEDLTVPPMSADIWWLVTEACTVAGRAVRILLECFFSSWCFHFVKKVWRIIGVKALWLTQVRKQASNRTIFKQFQTRKKLSKRFPWNSMRSSTVWRSVRLRTTRLVIILQLKHCRR